MFIAGALLVLAAFAAYHNSFSGPLVYDDIAATKENPTIQNLSALSTVLVPPSDTGTTVNGRPLVNLSLAINYAIGGYEVFSYHVFNLAIHLLAGLTLFGLVRRSLELPSLRDRFGPGEVALPFAFTVALLWTLHPLQTESVTYIIQRAESLVGLFYLLTFYGFIRSITSPRPMLWTGLSVASCLCGMASKEVMASAPLLVLVYDRALISGTFQAAWQRRRRLYLGLAGTWLLLAWLVRGSADRGGTAGFKAEGANVWHYALTQCLALGKYLKLTFWPSPIVFDYGTGVETSLLPVLPQALLIVALVVATGYALRRRPVLGFLGLWFFAILGPSSSFIPIVTETMAEHRMYLPLAAVLSLAVLGAGTLAGRRVIPLFLGLALVAGWLTMKRNEDYRDELTLWRDTQQKYPTNARAHNNVGEILFRQDKREEALACFLEAVRLLPNYVDALNNVGNTLAQVGRPAEGLPYLETALALRPRYAETYNNFGNTYYELGRLDEAVTNYREAVRLKPKWADAQSNLGVALAKQGKPAEALPYFEAALRLKENYTEAHYSYGSALDALGRTAEAMVQFNLTLALKPNHPEAHNNLGGVLFKQDKVTEALRHFETAVRLKPIYPDALHNLGVTLYKLGRTSEGVPYLA
ncbi:MAG: tetratricopeptide repeat protein [Verrucomicrobia bacterium]|nr:tetratricopeptide repeat protein [Verrucomicrobiota bacterium]